MPYGTRKAKGGGYDITKGGKKVGHSSSKGKAQRSINARNAGAHGWKGRKRG